MACPPAACEAILGWWRPNSDQAIVQDAFDDDEAEDEEEEEEPNGFYEVEARSLQFGPDGVYGIIIPSWQLI